LNDRERYKEAIAQYTTAALNAQQWQKAQPSLLFFTERFANICWFTSRAANNGGQADNALEWMNRAAVTYEQLLKQQPKDLTNYGMLRDLYKERGFLHSRLGKTQQYDADWKKADELDRELTRLLDSKLK
jgi:hypothetical protein